MAEGSACATSIWRGRQNPLEADVPECAGFVLEKPYRSTEELVFLALTFVCLLVLAGFAVYVNQNKETKLVERQGTMYFAAIFSGFALLLIGMLLWPLQSTQALCYLKPWFLALGYGLIAGSLTARIYFTYHFFYKSNNPDRDLKELLKYNQKQKIEKRNRKMRLIFSSIIAAELALIAFMIGIPGARPDVRYDCCEDEMVIYATCSFSGAFGWTAFAVNVFPLFFTIYWTYFILKVWYKQRVHLRSRDSRLSRSSTSHSTATSFNITGDGPEDEKRAEEQIAAALHRELKQLRPVLYIVLFVGTIALALTIIGYSDLPYDTEEGRIGYYLTRGICFLAVVMVSLILILFPMLAQIRTERRESMAQERVIDQEDADDDENARAEKTSTASTGSDASTPSQTIAQI